MIAAARRAAAAIAAIVVLAGAGACGRPTAATVTVLAAASLAEPLTRLAHEFERAEHRRVVLELAGSQQLVAQLEAGAPGDVLVLADERWMRRAVARGVAAPPVHELARNTLIVVTPARGVPRVRTLADLAAPGVRVVLADTAVPAGRYARTVLARLGRRAELGPDFARRVLANTVSLDESVRQVLVTVELGEGDAGIVYRTDARSAGARVRTVPIPAAENDTARYPIAMATHARDAAAARRFVALARSPAGERILRASGFLVRAP